MSDRRQNGATAPGTRQGDEDVDLRLGQHALALLQAARDSGDRALIIQAEAMAMAVGFALASRLPNDLAGDD